MAGACARDFSEEDDYMLPRPQAPCAFQKVGVLSRVMCTISPRERKCAKCVGLASHADTKRKKHHHQQHLQVQIQ